MNIPKQYNQLMPYLVVEAAWEFLVFAKKVFGAVEQLIVPRQDGTIMHGELRIGEAVIMFADTNENAMSTTSGFCIIVEDVEAVYHNAIAHGAVSIQLPEEKEYGKAAGFQDKFGNNGGLWRQ